MKLKPAWAVFTQDHIEKCMHHYPLLHACYFVPGLAKLEFLEAFCMVSFILTLYFWTKQSNSYIWLQLPSIYLYKSHLSLFIFHDCPAPPMGGRHSIVKVFIGWNFLLLQQELDESIRVPHCASPRGSHSHSNTYD